MNTNTTTNMKNTYFLLALIESLDRRLAKNLRSSVAADPGNPMTVLELRNLLNRRLPSFEVDKRMFAEA